MLTLMSYICLGEDLFFFLSFSLFFFIFLFLASERVPRPKRGRRLCISRPHVGIKIEKKKCPDRRGGADFAYVGPMLALRSRKKEVPRPKRGR